MDELLNNTYYGNTVLEWLTALIIILAAVVVGKFLYWVSGNLIRRLTSKTKTALDDTILDMVEEPVVLLLTIAGTWYGLSTLALPELADSWRLDRRTRHRRPGASHGRKGHRIERLRWLYHL